MSNVHPFKDKKDNKIKDKKL